MDAEHSLIVLPGEWVSDGDYRMLLPARDLRCSAISDSETGLPHSDSKNRIRRELQGF